MTEAIASVVFLFDFNITFGNNQYICNTNLNI